MQQPNRFQDPAHLDGAWEKREQTTRRSRLIAVLLSITVLLGTGVAIAADAGANDVGATLEVASAESPRASLEKFLALCGAGRYAEAAVYLDISGRKDANPAMLARHLKAVLDRHWIDLAEVSGKSEGALDDGL